MEFEKLITSVTDLLQVLNGQREFGFVYSGRLED